MLDTLDHLAGIATAIVALLAYGGYSLRKIKRRRALENYLLLARNGNGSVSRGGTSDKGQRTLPHLSAALKMTEEEILDVAFSSKRIHTLNGKDPATQRADCLLFQHKAGRD